MPDFIKSEPQFEPDEKKFDFLQSSDQQSGKAHRRETEDQLADVIHNLEALETERLAFMKTEKNNRPTRAWFKIWRRSRGNKTDNAINALDETIENDDVKQKKNKKFSVFSAGAIGLETIGLAGIFGNIKGSMILGIFHSADAVIRAGTIALAIGCGSLPFIAYHFQGRGAEGASDQVLASSDGTDNQTHSKQYKKVKFEPIDRVNPNAKYDYDSTEAIMSNGKGLPKAKIPAQYTKTSKPVASKTKSFVVKQVVNGMAMIEYEHGYWFAAPGSTLPDGSRYMHAIRDKQSGKLELKTTHGSVPVAG